MANNVRYTIEQQLEDMDSRIKRIETRLCRLMIALDVDPNRGPDEPANSPQPYTRRTEPPRDYADTDDRGDETRGRGLFAVFAGKE